MWAKRDGRTKCVICTESLRRFQKLLRRNRGMELRITLSTTNGDQCDVIFLSFRFNSFALSFDQSSFAPILSMCARNKDNKTAVDQLKTDFQRSWLSSAIFTTIEAGKLISKRKGCWLQFNSAISYDLRTKKMRCAFTLNGNYVKRPITQDV